MTDLTIIIPSIRNQFWKRYYDSVAASIVDCTFDIIFIGPYCSLTELDNISNVKYIKSYACPSRCYQEAVLLANSEFVTVSTDDGVCLPNGGLKNSIKLLRQSDKKDAVCSRYWEGIDFSGNDITMPPEYWTVSYHHGWYNLPGIPQHYILGGSMILRLDYFYKLGGIDCQYETTSLSTHDLGFRLQNNGGTIHLSPDVIYSYDLGQDDRQPMEDALRIHDYPIFKEFYSQPRTDHIHIDYNNWRNVPNMWRRFSN